MHPYYRVASQMKLFMCSLCETVSILRDLVRSIPAKLAKISKAFYEKKIIRFICRR